MIEGIAILRLEKNFYFILVTGNKTLVFVYPIRFCQVKPADTVFDVIPFFIDPIGIVITVLVGIDVIAAATDGGGVGRLFTGNRLGHIVNDDVFNDAVVAHTEFIVDGNVVLRVHIICLMCLGIIAVDHCPNIRLTAVIGNHRRKRISRFRLHFHRKLVIFPRNESGILVHQFPVIHAVVGHKPEAVLGIVVAAAHSGIAGRTINRNRIIGKLTFFGGGNKNRRRIDHILFRITDLTHIIVVLIHMLTESGYFTAFGTDTHQLVTVVFFTGISVGVGAGGQVIPIILIIMPCRKGDIHRSGFVALLVGDDTRVGIFGTTGILGHQQFQFRAVIHFTLPGVGQRYIGLFTGNELFSAPGIGQLTFALRCHTEIGEVALVITLVGVVGIGGHGIFGLLGDENLANLIVADITVAVTVLVLVRAQMANLFAAIANALQNMAVLRSFGIFVGLLVGFI